MRIQAIFVLFCLFLFLKFCFVNLLLWWWFRKVPLLVILNNCSSAERRTCWSSSICYSVHESSCWLDERAHILSLCMFQRHIYVEFFFLHFLLMYCWVEYIALCNLFTVYKAVCQSYVSKVFMKIPTDYSCHYLKIVSDMWLPMPCTYNASLAWHVSDYSRSLSYSFPLIVHLNIPPVVPR